MFNLKLSEESCETEVGSIMSDLSLPLQVSIGEINMSVSEVIRLESGEVVSFNLGDSSLVTLLLGGEPLATASMSIEGSEIILKIIDVFLNQESEKNDNLEEAQTELLIVTE